MTDHKIHLSIQIVPRSAHHRSYDLIDKAIEVIRQSGVKYMITPMETVMEGDYNTVTAIAHEAQKAVMEAGADEVLVYIKMHYRKDGDVTFEEKRLDR